MILVLVSYLFIGKNNNEELIINKKYSNKNIEINYPYFNNKIIDDYIDNYLNNKINSFNYYDYHYFFLDYDYYLGKNNINLTFYEMKNKDNMQDFNTKTLTINVKEKVIEESLSKKNKDENSYVKEKDNYDKIIAFTFDDGPNYNTNKLLDVLHKYKVTATFFVLGSKIKSNEDIIRKMDSYNMEIGNHTYSHKLLTKMNGEEIKNEIEKTNQLLFNILGYYPKITRPSYGSVNKKVKSNIDTPIVIWNVDTLDWKYHNSNRIVNNILKNIKDGDIILMHDIYSATVNAVDKVIPKLQEKGYRIVSVSELFKNKGKKMEKNRVYGSA